MGKFGDYFKEVGRDLKDIVPDMVDGAGIAAREASREIKAALRESRKEHEHELEEQKKAEAARVEQKKQALLEPDPRHLMDARRAAAAEVHAREQHAVESRGSRFMSGHDDGPTAQQAAMQHQQEMAARQQFMQNEQALAERRENIMQQMQRDREAAREQRGEPAAYGTVAPASAAPPATPGSVEALGGDVPMMQKFVQLIRQVLESLGAGGTSLETTLAGPKAEEAAPAVQTAGTPKVQRSAMAPG